MREVKIGDKVVSETSPIFFIAEIGINHNGSLENAKKLIDMAVYCGCDAVKFQKRTPELCVPEDQKDVPRNTPWGTMTYLEYKKQIEFGEEEYFEINEYCKKKGIMWSASAWDLPSLEFLEMFNVPFHKVASPMLTHREFLEAIRDIGKPTILSTGMSTLEEIDKAVNLLRDIPIVIMHCNSAYPAEDEELNLSVIKTLQERYPDIPIGYSGHELGISASLVAGVMGARVIERHITLDRTMWGTDHAASIEFSGLRRLVRDLKKIPVWTGNGKKRVYGSEEAVKKKLRSVDTL